MTRLKQAFILGLLVGSVCIAQTTDTVRILGVVPGEAGALELRLACPESLHGTAWQIYGCEPGAGDQGSLWRPLGSPVTLSENEQRVAVPESDESVSFYLLRRADGSGMVEAQVMRLSRVPAPDGNAALIRIEMLNAEQTHVLFETRFETAEGYRLGALSQKAGWSVFGEVVVATAPNSDGQSIRLSGPAARLSRVLETGESTVRVEYALYVSSTGVVKAASQPERPPKRSSSIGYHPSHGFLAFDGDGNGGGRWVLVPDSKFFDQWVRVAFDLDYGTKAWSIAINDDVLLEGLGFRDAELESFREMHVYPGDGYEMFVDDVRVTGSPVPEETEK